VLDPAFYPAVVFGGAPGAAEAYIDRFWETDDLTGLLRVFARGAHSREAWRAAGRASASRAVGCSTG
jgi:hypothetical protein